MTPDLGTTNLWLAVLAIATAGQFVMLLGAALMLFKVYKRAASTIDTLEHEQIRPLLMRVNALIDDVQDITARARHVDDAVRAKLEGVESALHSTKTVVQDRIWPLVGVVRAMRAGFDAWLGAPTPVRRRA
jgi:uncharacterized protein YoxC